MRGVIGTGSFPLCVGSLTDTCGLQDASLRHTLQFGIGLHHAGLTDTDRKVVEALFVAGKIQVG